MNSHAKKTNNILWNFLTTIQIYQALPTNCYLCEIEKINDWKSSVLESLALVFWVA